ncbi:DMT family transporter [Alkalilimnicola ehrlichii MLHE-1]|uniref:EamA domain-containing protein n=1 Tax=Alkalilimnicola ehrlichii (strain ATCC BAA-1101 / DSM 17681 / MLHE-1) TaxID=187272 RepID=Q0A9G9_ALKEH|nr:DMT family transporter [Alkalilimnicola ehrlichii]ABI56518.1 protein of unknown function DUF6, transmembrane [Alkalilimnicola ehrlichii MLHE-1]
MSDAVRRGATLIIIAELLLATMAATIKAASAELPSEMLVFFRNLFGLLLLLPLLVRGGRRGLATRVPHLHLLRGLAGVGAMYCFFWTIAHMPLAEALLVKLSAPFFLPLIAWLWLRETLSGRTVLAIAVGFLGVYFILQPNGAMQGAALQVGAVGLAGAALAALAKVTIRRMGPEESSRRVVFWFGVTATTVSALPLPWVWQTPTGQTLVLLVVLGACATSAQLLLTRAFAIAPSGRLGPFTYISVVFGSLYGWWIWGELLGPMTLLGMALVIGAGLLNLTLRRPAAPPARRPAEEHP